MIEGNQTFENKKTTTSINPSLIKEPKNTNRILQAKNTAALIW
jgi:hypothetical protein